MLRIIRIIIISACVISLLAMIAGCVKRRETGKEGQVRNSRSIEQVFDSNRDSLLSIPGVVGAGIAKLGERPSIMVMVQEKTPDIEKRIPKEIDGYSVIIEETGPFKALDR